MFAQFWFKISDGDKDLFRFAFLAVSNSPQSIRIMAIILTALDCTQLRKRWAAPGRYVGAGALPGNTLSGFCGHVSDQPAPGSLHGSLCFFRRR